MSKYVNLRVQIRDADVRQTAMYHIRKKAKDKLYWDANLMCIIYYILGKTLNYCYAAQC